MQRNNTDRTENRLVTIARKTLGFACLVVWAIGVVLPIIPGWPALIVAIVLLGRRDRTLRWMHLVARRTLRWLRLHPSFPISRAGRWLSTQYLNARRAIGPALVAAERNWGV